MEARTTNPIRAMEATINDSTDIVVTNLRDRLFSCKLPTCCWVFFCLRGVFSFGSLAVFW